LKLGLVAILLALASSAQGLHVTITSDDDTGEACKTLLFVDASDAAAVDYSISIDGTKQGRDRPPLTSYPSSISQDGYLASWPYTFM
jgi:hypothetical protein